MLKERPRIHIVDDGTDRLLNLITFLFLLAILAYSAVMVPSLDDRVPLHVNLSGEVDRFGSKYTIFIFPGIALFIYCLLTYLLRIPHVYNYGQEVTPENAHDLYRRGKFILRVVRLWAVLVVAVVLYEFVDLARSGSTQAAPWLLPFIIGTSILIVIFSLYNSIKKKPISE